jgi:protein subunit release factor A
MPTDLPANLVARLDQMASEFDRLSAQLEDPAVVVDHKKVRELSVKRTALTPVVSSYRDFKGLTAEADELRARHLFQRRS